MEDPHDLLSMQDAAELWNRVLFGDCEPTGFRPITAQGFRKKCRDGTFASAGLPVVSLPGRYYVSRASPVRE